MRGGTSMTLAEGDRAVIYRPKGLDSNANPQGAAKNMPALADLRDQAVAGVSPPQVNEAIIREVWPSVAAYPAAANFARFTYRTYILAPLGWLALAPRSEERRVGKECRSRRSAYP